MPNAKVQMTNECQMTKSKAKNSGRDFLALGF
jgi:hypothetical protein